MGKRERTCRAEWQKQIERWNDSGLSAASVIAAIDLDDEADARRVEVSDETEQRYLATKRDLSWLECQS